jgi:hypothetical protein
MKLLERLEAGLPDGVTQDKVGGQRLVQESVMIENWQCGEVL